MLTVLLVVLIVLALASLFYRPLGTGYYSYGPSVLLWILVILVVLWLLGVI